MNFTVVPLTLKFANLFITQHHRHNKRVVGCKFSIGAEYNNKLVGVAVVGRPITMRLDDMFTVEVLRCCVLENAPKNTCSFLYGRSWRIWQQMGGKKILTYTLARESGSSLKAVGWKNVHTSKPLSKNAKGWRARPNRAWQDVYSELKYRWEKKNEH